MPSGVDVAGAGAWEVLVSFTVGVGLIDTVVDSVIVTVGTAAAFGFPSSFRSLEATSSLL